MTGFTLKVTRDLVSASHMLEIKTAVKQHNAAVAALREAMSHKEAQGRADAARMRLPSLYASAEPIQRDSDRYNILSLRQKKSQKAARLCS